MKKPEKITWDSEIRELEEFFSSRELPEKIRLNSWSMIIYTKLFIDTHLSIVKHNNGNNLFFPYLNRLYELKKQLENDTQTT